MDHPCIGEHPLADSSITSVTFPKGSIRDFLADKTYSACPSPSKPQIGESRAFEAETDHHASWASALPIPEVIPLLISFGTKGNLTPSWIAQSAGYLSDTPDLESGNRTPPHHSGDPENSVRPDSPPLSSVNFSTANGALSPSYNWHQHFVGTITCTPVTPPHLLSRPDQFASCSTQPTNFRISRSTLPSMDLDGIVNLCPRCYANFPTAWTMEQLGCVHCNYILPCPIVAQQETSPSPLAAPPPAMSLDRPRSPSICPFQTTFHNLSRKGKSPQPRVRRPAKTQPPTTVQESRCCPFTSSGNITLPCDHSKCSPPPNVGLLSRRPTESDKWERARQDAVASFSYENCGCKPTHLSSYCSP